MKKYRSPKTYLGAWAYTLLSILYMIPVAGWVILAIHCFDRSNENRLHFARSIVVKAMLLAIVLVILCGVLLAMGKLTSVTGELEKIGASLADGWQNLVQAAK